MEGSFSQKRKEGTGPLLLSYNISALAEIPFNDADFSSPLLSKLKKSRKGNIQSPYLTNQNPTRKQDLLNHTKSIKFLSIRMEWMLDWESNFYLM